jgi:hypothetical protein
MAYVVEDNHELACAPQCNVLDAQQMVYNETASLWMMGLDVEECVLTAVANGRRKCLGRARSGLALEEVCKGCMALRA